jgi:hypothetical protein
MNCSHITQAIHQTPLPWIVVLGMAIFWGALGSAYLFFCDHLCDWQIRLLQSRGQRLFIRCIGLVLLLLIVPWLWFGLTGKIR